VGSELSRWAAKDQIDEWIASVVANQTFADIGGIGVNSGNERITFAIQCGAKSATMIDFRPADYYEWDIFRRVCAQKEISNYREMASIDINDPQLYEKIGSYYVVHCTGVLYHMPSPLLAFENLATVVEKYLIVNTITVPERIENKFGVLNFSEGIAVFLPGIGEYERSILREHYQTKFGWSIDDVAPRLSNHEKTIMPWREEGQLSCWPYWWLFTDSSFRSLVQVMGFQILGEYKWEDHTLQIFAEKMRSSEQSLSEREGRSGEGDSPSTGEEFWARAGAYPRNRSSDSWRTSAYSTIRRLFLPCYRVALDRKLNWVVSVKNRLKRVLLRK